MMGISSCSSLSRDWTSLETPSGVINVVLAVSTSVSSLMTMFAGGTALSNERSGRGQSPWTTSPWKCGGFSNWAVSPVFDAAEAVL